MTSVPSPLALPTASPEAPVTVVRADLGALAHRQAVLDLLNGYMADPMGGSLPPQSPGTARELVEGLAALPTTMVLLGRSGARYVAIAVCFHGFSTFNARPLINIHDVYVAPALRGKGVARRLLAEIETIARAKGCCKITLEVRHDNRAAQKVYAACGFGDESVPMYFWAKKLS